jgi:hypothetical protein
MLTILDIDLGSSVECVATLRVICKMPDRSQDLVNDAFIKLSQTTKIAAPPALASDVCPRLAMQHDEC